MQYGYRIVKDLRQGLQDYMERMEFERIDDFVGLALANIKRHNDLSRVYRLVSSVDVDECIGCGSCSVVCNDSGYQAIIMSDAKRPIINEEKCDGCGLCSHICPISDCIKLIPKSRQ
jgi:dihydropyrimidine dehydrogenase (NAD+) subunit PreA